MVRYMNMFVVIGVALIVVSLAGFATGGKFLMEPGQPVDSSASLIYLGAGVLMLFNGILTVKTMPPPVPQPNAPSADKPESPDEAASQ